MNKLKYLFLSIVFLFGLTPAMASGPTGTVYYNNSTSPYIGTAPVTVGGTGIATTPTDGQLFIGKTSASGYVLGTLTAGPGIGVTNGSGSITLSNQFTVTTKTNTSFTAVAGNFYPVTVSSADSTVTLPDATTCSGESLVVFVKAASGGHTIGAWTTASSQTINGGAASSLANLSVTNTYYIFVSDGANWNTLGSSARCVDGTLTISPVNGVPIFSVNASALSIDLSSGVINTLPVGHGGTGQTSFTAHGVLIGNTASALNVTGAGTNTYPLCANTSADPTFQQLALGAIVGIAQNTILGSVTSGTNSPVALTATQLTTIPNLATDLLKGSLPALTDAQIVVGKTSSNVQAVAMSGDITITNTGVTTIKTNVALAGSPTTTTQATSDNSTNIATTAYVKSVLPAPAYGFGGSGSDGAITGASSNTAPIQKNATTWALTGANTYTIGTANTANTGSLTIINCTSTFTLGDATNASTITIAAGSGASGGQGAPTVGGRGNGGTNGAGPGAGQGDHLGVNTSAGNKSGGGGAGFGGAGGNGGGGDGGGGASNAGQTYSSWSNGGSGGGGGSNGESSGTGGNGGNGGGSLIVCSVGAINCKAASVINCKGGNGSAATTAGGGGGGGSGGLVFLASQTSVTVAGTINVTGGNGGNATGTGGGAGAGGSGRIICWSPSNSTGSATFTMSGGTHGSNAGSQTDGSDGSSGSEQNITGTPNLPLLTWLQTNEGNNALALFHQMGINDINQKSLAWMAGKTLQGMCYYNMGNFEESTCMGVGDFDKKLSGAS